MAAARPPAEGRQKWPPLSGPTHKPWAAAAASIHVDFVLLPSFLPPPRLCLCILFLCGRRGRSRFRLYHGGGRKDPPPRTSAECLGECEGKEETRGRIPRTSYVCGSTRNGTPPVLGLRQRSRDPLGLFIEDGGGDADDGDYVVVGRLLLVVRRPPLKPLSPQLLLSFASLSPLFMIAKNLL